MTAAPVLHAFWKSESFFFPRLHFQKHLTCFPKYLWNLFNMAPMFKWHLTNWVGRSEAAANTKSLAVQHNVHCSWTSAWAGTETKTNEGQKFLHLAAFWGFSQELHQDWKPLVYILKPDRCVGCAPFLLAARHPSQYKQLCFLSMFLFPIYWAYEKQLPRTYGRQKLLHSQTGRWISEISANRCP